MLLKSYADDFDYARTLVASYQKYNSDSIPLWIVVPDSDLEQFRTLAGPSIEFMPESAFGEFLVHENVAGIRPGYINQEIVKLSFWETGLVANYFCVDSEAVFVRPFTHDDFMFDQTTPYTVLVEDNELKVEPRYYADHWQGREKSLRRIQELVGLDDRRILTCHGHQVFSRTVLHSLKEDFLEPQGWSYRDLLAEAPYEFSWYNMWLQKTRVIPIEIREPLVKVFHHEGQELEYALRGISLEDIGRGYVALVINSNYARSIRGGDAAGSAEEVLARYMPASVLSKALARRVRDTAARRIRG